MFLFLHRLLGLTVGLIVLISCITGSFLVFKNELNQILFNDRYFVKIEKERISLDAILQGVSELPNHRISTVTWFADPGRTIELSFKKQESIKRGSETIAYVNPYSGKIISELQMENDFFLNVENLHRRLMLNDFGKAIIGISTIIFIVIIISGLIIWFPSTIRSMKNRLVWTGKGNWRAMIYQWHIVSGFYLSGFFTDSVTHRFDICLQIDKQQHRKSY